MKINNKIKKNLNLSVELKNFLVKYRAAKNFVPKTYIHSKANLLNEYIKNNLLDTCVVAISGGIDSAVVLSIINFAKNQKNSSIKKIIPVLMPIFNNPGTTGQEKATENGKTLCKNLNLSPYIIPLETTHKILKNSADKVLNIKGDHWSSGQLVSYVRTPTLYYITALLSCEKKRGVICGTTNRDEGLYLGYFGKASDGMVDLQIISDLHKSEVYKVANFLKVPNSVINRQPTGDMYDGRLDEEVFGASYDFVELYMWFLSISYIKQQNFYKSLSLISKKEFDFFSKNLENLHNYNLHKYLNFSPAIHLDLNVLKIKNGWKNNCTINLPCDNPINNKFFVNLKNVKKLPDFFSNFSEANIKIKTHKIQNNNVYEFFNLLSQEECVWILEQLTAKDWKKSNIYGVVEPLTKNVKPKNIEVGSLRKSWYSTELADILFDRIIGRIPNLEYYEGLTEITTPHHSWTFSGVSPLMRFIRYKKNQFLIPHYDNTYKYNSYKKTLKSLVIYLDDNQAQTRFLFDKQKTNKNFTQNYSDFDKTVDGELVIKSFQSKAGNAIIFPHRILHDMPPLNLNYQKTIIRTDLIYCAPFLGLNIN